MPGHLLVGAAIAVALAGCAGQPPPAAKPAETPAAGAAKAGPEASPKVPGQSASPQAGAPTPLAAIAGATSAAKATSPAATAAPATAASPQRGEPKGRLVYAWNVAITPSWFDPQENPQLVTPYGFQYALHDALVKHMPGQPFAPSLAESYEIAPDFKSATFKLREGVKFHNGDPVTTEDVKFTFEKYRGANNKILKDKTERVETPDARTVRFVFKEPFLDFQILYGSPASGAGWIVPKKYYEQVGPDGFKRQPIGAGPFRYVRETGANEYEFEAVPDYWRKTPTLKTVVMRGVPEASTRLAQLQTGEADVVQAITGPLLDVVKSDPTFQVAPIRASAQWLEFPLWERPDSPFNNAKVRQAISLALDRQAMSQAEEGGFSEFEGNWVPEDWPGAIKRPMPEYNPGRARQLLGEAGHPNGFEVEQLIPWPPYSSFGERIITQLRDVGIRVRRLNPMERGAISAKLGEGPEAFGTAPTILMLLTAAPGDAASRIRSYATCTGSSSRTCIPIVDEKFNKYEASANPAERTQLLNEIQEYLLDNHVYVPLYRQAFIQVVGPRLANKWDEVMGAIPQYVYIGPYEDVQVKD